MNSKRDKAAEEYRNDLLDIGNSTVTKRDFKAGYDRCLADLQSETPEFPEQEYYHWFFGKDWPLSKDDCAIWAWSQAWAIANAKIKELEEKLEGR